jgi:hypothetical protein
MDDVPLGPYCRTFLRIREGFATADANHDLPELRGTPVPMHFGGLW